MLKLSPAARADLEQRLQAGPFDFRSVPHAVFSARGEGVTATLYTSGKLVVQGADPEAFAQRFVEGAELPLTGGSSAASEEEEPLVGSDECGKGDYFGPLVVVALRLEPEDTAALRAGGQVGDSKRLSDPLCLRLGPALADRFPCAVEVLDPPDYNDTYDRVGNLNPLLAELHAKAIRGVAGPGDRVLVDQFANERLMRTALKGTDVRLEQRPRAEAAMAVAAASVVARWTFLERLAALSESFGADLHKGAGAPTEAAARRFLEVHGRGALREVAKLHFRTTVKIGGGP